MRPRNKQIERNAARQQIRSLFDQARKVFAENHSLADRKVAMARKVAMKHRMRMPRELKRQFCKHCYAFLKPGASVRIRNRDGNTVYQCFACKKYMRFPHKS